MDENSVPKALCERCNKRPATIFLTTVVAGKAKSQKLCEVCQRESALAVETDFLKRLKELIDNGKCKYCGAQAVTGGFGSSSAFGEQMEYLMCMACQQDLIEFVKNPENALPDIVPSDQEAVMKKFSQYAEYQRKQEEFIKQRVSERRLNGPS